MKKIYFFCLFFFFTNLNFAQTRNDSSQNPAPFIYLDCDRCDYDYIKTEVPFVNFVRERKDAQIHILVTTQGTGSGGEEYTLTFIGQKNFTGKNDTLTFYSQQNATDEEIRKTLVQRLKLGLIPYVAKTPVADQVDIFYKKPKTLQQPVKDKWNYWVFRLNVNTFLNGERSFNFISLFGTISANRITNNWKTRISFTAGYDESTFTIGGSKVRTFQKSFGFRGLLVKSLTNHWSAGFFLNTSSSTFSNTDLDLMLAPAFEYNIFPYSESTRRELRILYRVGYNGFRYREETIFNKLSENLMIEKLSVTLETTQTWGSTEFTLEGSHFFHDFSKLRLEIFSELSLRLFKGLSFRLFGRIRMIRDQLSLPKGGATTEEILLRRKELATSYDYFASIGLSYTFGSIYSTVVNPRFGR